MPTSPLATLLNSRSMHEDLWNDQYGLNSVLEAAPNPIQDVHLFSGGPPEVLPRYHSIHHPYLTLMETLNVHVATIERLEQDHATLTSLFLPVWHATDYQRKAGLPVDPLKCTLVRRCEIKEVREPKRLPGHEFEAKRTKIQKQMREYANKVYEGIVKSRPTQTSLWRSLLRYLKELQAVTTPEEYAAKVPFRLKEELVAVSDQVHNLTIRIQRSRGSPGLWIDRIWA
ncbi:hypothetical protein IWZ01DRAFT_483103 [Phyllosticta capitalensis]